jgi:hypothetical protein
MYTISAHDEHGAGEKEDYSHDVWTAAMVYRGSVALGIKCEKIIELSKRKVDHQHNGNSGQFLFRLWKTDESTNLSDRIE